MSKREHKKVYKISSDEKKNILKKMLSDKRSINSYIQKNGTLNGFKDDTVIFAKPL